MIDDTTVKTKAADRLTELREAHNVLALAIRKCNRTRSAADRDAVEQARKTIADIEKAYRDGYKHQLEAVCEKQPGYRAQRSFPWLRRKLIRN